ARSSSSARTRVDSMMLATACSATSITAASSLAVDGPAGVSSASLGSSSGDSAPPPSISCRNPSTSPFAPHHPAPLAPIARLFELDHPRLLGTHRRLEPVRLLERPQLLPTLRGLSRHLL